MPAIGGARGVVGSAGRSFSSLTVPGQSYVAGTTNTRRARMTFGDGFFTNTTYQDMCTRAGFILPVTPTRCRIIVRNNAVTLNTTVPLTMNFTGIWWGTPNTTSEPTWLGDFATAPTQVLGPFVVDPGATGAEYTSAWFTPPKSFAPYGLQGLSYGLTVATDNTVRLGADPGLTWHGVTGAGCAAIAGGAAAPLAAGTLSPATVVADVRLEYEFVGPNQIGFFIGDSLTAGSYASYSANSFGQNGPASSWPMIGTIRLGHCAQNGGSGGAVSNTFLSTSALAYTRFDFATCVPDYAVIALGVNDSATSNLTTVANTPNTLANYTANILQIITNLQALGINKIYLCTIPPGPPTYITGSPATTFQVGTLGTAQTNGFGGAVISPVVVNLPAGSSGGWPGASSSTNAYGPPGRATDWYNAAIATGPKGAIWIGIPGGNANTLGVTLDGPYPVTIAAGGAGIAVTLTTSGTTVYTHAVGEPVFALREGYRQVYNSFIRSQPPEISAVIDMAPAAEFGLSYPTQQSPLYYGVLADVHPQGPGLYNVMAQAFVAALGI